MRQYLNGVGVGDYRRSLGRETRLKWFKKKGLDGKKQRHHRDYRNAVAICHRKIRYSFILATYDAIRLRNYVYKCIICNYWHTSRQSKSMNRIVHYREAST